MYTVGLHPDGKLLRIAMVESRKGKKKIIFTKEFEEPTPLKKSVLKEASFREDRVEFVTGLSSDEVLIRNFDLPLKQRKKVLEALPFQIESTIPAPQDEAVLLPLLQKRDKATSVTLYNFRKEALKGHLNNLSSLGFDPDIVSSVPTALFRFAMAHVLAKKFAILHFFQEKASLVTIVDGTIVQSLSIREDLLPRALEALEKRGDLEGILVTGLVKEIDSLLPFIKIKETKLLPYAVEIGLALEGAEKEGKRLQLRVGKFLPKRQRERMKRRITIYIGLTALFSLLAFSALFFTFRYKESSIKERFKEVTLLQKEQEQLMNADPVIMLTEVKQDKGDFIVRFISPTEEKAREFFLSLETLGTAKLAKEADGYRITISQKTAL